MAGSKNLLKMKTVVNFIETEFDINNSIKTIQDDRKKTQISTATVYKSELYETIVGKGKSFLQMDQILRDLLLGAVDGTGQAKWF